MLQQHGIGYAVSPPLRVQQVQQIEHVQRDLCPTARYGDALPERSDGGVRRRLAAAVASKNGSTLSSEAGRLLDESLEGRALPLDAQCTRRVGVVRARRVEAVEAYLTLDR